MRKTKKGRLRVNCKAFFAWVGDGVGGPLGGDKAYRKLALKHHPDKVKCSMKVVLKDSMFWKMAFQVPVSLERPTNVFIFSLAGKMAPWICLDALNVQLSCLRLFFFLEIVAG